MRTQALKIEPGKFYSMQTNELSNLFADQACGSTMLKAGIVWAIMGLLATIVILSQSG